MTGLHELRRTLDQHAHDVVDDAAPARAADVHARVRRVRRQRVAGVGVAAALALVATVSVALLPGGREPVPADRELLGQTAPETLTALGWTYRFAEGTQASGSDSLTTRLPTSDSARLVTWATAGGDQEVSVRSPGTPAWRSSAGDFDDYAWIAPGGESRVTVSASRPGVALAVYEVDPAAAPAGVGEGVLTFREEVAGYDLRGATVGDPGEASVQVALEPGTGTAWIGYACEGLPRGVQMNVGFRVGQPRAFGGCGSGSTFDPGGSPGVGLGPELVEGRATLHMWLTRGRDRELVADDEVPGVRLGVGAYVRSDEVERVGFYSLPQEMEAQGHVWRLQEVAHARGATPKLTVPEDGSDYLVEDAVSASGPLRYRLTRDGRAFSERIYTDLGGGSRLGGVRARAGEVYGMAVSGGRSDRVREAGLFLYRRVD